MPYQDTKTLTARGQIQLRFAKRATKAVNVFQCLIVSSDDERRAMFERAAADGGWNTLLCADAPTALTYINRSLVQLAIVDLESQQAEAFRPVVQQFTATSGLLLIVCGNEGEIEEEVWVRQLGAWLYLPGVADTSNFALLCVEARHIAERLWKSNGGARANGVPAVQNNHPS
jgi:DNA-binding NtrC family response regulator